MSVSRKIEKEHPQTLADYFKLCYEHNIVDHAIRATVSEEGQVSFYIHPACVSGDTVNFKLKDNHLTTVHYCKLLGAGKLPL